ncbi:unnamed protein product [Rhizophagus irregularis]|nr:unnamed protein product [Rhizophagus irregularis]
MQKCWNSDPIKRPEADDIIKKLYDILEEEVSNPTEIIKSSDIAPIDNPNSKQLSNETISSKELEPLYPKHNTGEKRMIRNNLIEDTNCGYYKSKADEFDIYI